MLIPNDIVTNSVSERSEEDATDFSEYMWMMEEDLEAFDNTVLNLLEVMDGHEVENLVLNNNNNSSQDELDYYYNEMINEEIERDTVYYCIPGFSDLGFVSEDDEASAYELHCPYEQVVDDLESLSEVMGSLNVSDMSTLRDRRPNVEGVKLNPNAKPFIPESVDLAGCPGPNA